MAGKEDYRIFVGGLAWDITERQIENAFSRFGKILACQVMVERDTGRSRGFGFITYSDRRAMDDAIAQMHGCEFGDRLITVNEAQPRMADDIEPTFQRNYSTGGRGSAYRSGGNGRPVAGPDDCFKCGRPGHWARDCPSSGGRGGPPASFAPRSRFAGPPDRFPDRDRFGDRERDRFVDDRYDGGRYNDRERFESRDTRYSGRDRYVGDRYQAPGGERFVSERYGTSDRYVGNGYGKERAYERGSGERYGSGGPARNERNYRSRPEPYERPSRGGGRPSSFERY